MVESRNIGCFLRLAKLHLCTHITFFHVLSLQDYDVKLSNYIFFSLSIQDLNTTWTTAFFFLNLGRVVQSWVKITQGQCEI